MNNRYGADRFWPFADGGATTLSISTAVLVVALAIWLFRPGIPAALLFFVAAVQWLFMLYFFRDPNRETNAAPGEVIAPGDGRVVAIVREQEESYLNGEMLRISMFLAVTDVHVQRAPVAGEVTLVEHRPGRYLQAFRPEASDVNEHIAMIIRTPHGEVLLKQIAGILARRCVNHARVGDPLVAGQRFGLIKFGSRLDLFLPPDASVQVRIGDKVLGGVTLIGRLPSNN